MFALIIGVVVGTYSSVFIATPIMFDSLRKTKDRPRKALETKESKEEN
jgi:SecD/SecF fusion protein